MAQCHKFWTKCPKDRTAGCHNFWCLYSESNTMASSLRIWCKCCKRSDFRCQHGLSQHLLKSPCHLQVQIEVDRVERHPLVHLPVHFAQASDIALHQNLCNRSEPEDLPLPPPSPPKKTAAIMFQDANDIAQHDLDVVTHQLNN